MFTYFRKKNIEIPLSNAWQMNKEKRHIFQRVA